MFVASTGVIGEVLPHEKLVAALPALHAALRDDGWEAAARGIMTTDTFPKASTRTARIGEAEVRITGIAKGSGMIAPDMATMLCFVFTDAKMPARGAAGAAEEGRRPQLQLHHGRFRHLHLRHRAADRHRPGEASARAGRGRRRCWRISRRRWTTVLMDLALQVVRDGEGAQKLVRIDVTGAVERTLGQADRRWRWRTRRW